MSILPDNKLVKLINSKRLIIDPFFSGFLGPNTYYCHLGNKFLFPKHKTGKFDPLTMESKDFFDELETNELLTMKPQSFLLAETFEFLGIDDEHVVRLMNSSSLARCGISHAAVGMINAGCGMEKPVKLTLELINSSPFDIILTPTKVQSDGKIVWGTEVLKIAVQTMESKPDRPYDKWRYAAYNTDQKPSSSKMLDRFDMRITYMLPPDSLHKIINKNTKL